MPIIVKILRWIQQIVLVLAACFFLLFGIQNLISSYQFNNPSMFIILFFSSSFIILISATLLFIFIYKMIVPRKEKPDNEK
jgi:TRAP-type C4-dicarboxylate transport system permease small subunit